MGYCQLRCGVALVFDLNELIQDQDVVRTTTVRSRKHLKYLLPVGMALTMALNRLELFNSIIMFIVGCYW